jgi:hypothetical protein
VRKRIEGSKKGGRAVRCLELLLQYSISSAVLIHSYSPPLSSKSRPRPSRQLPFCPRHLSTPRLSHLFVTCPPFLPIFFAEILPNHFMSEESLTLQIYSWTRVPTILLHFPCRGCLNPQLRRRSAHDAARRTLSTANGPGLCVQTQLRRGNLRIPTRIGWRAFQREEWCCQR